MDFDFRIFFSVCFTETLRGHLEAQIQAVDNVPSLVSFVSIHAPSCLGHISGRHFLGHGIWIQDLNP